MCGAQGLATKIWTEGKVLRGKVGEKIGEKIEKQR